MTWTHQGKPLGQPQRPWRLTRAQRVEMEAALSALRPGRPGYSATPEHVLHASDVLGAWCPLAPLPVGRDAWRVLRARVAIALRAALRLDEDARCEALYAEGHRRGARLLVNTSEGRAYRDGAALGWTVAVNAGREWPGVRRGTHDDLVLVPLALWEVDERRRRETVRAVVALLTWGLS